MPRLLDRGQCNDAFGAVQVALGLAKAFNCTVNDLPLSIVLSWFEQKAVAVLLSLLALGVKGIRLGPVPPAFVTPNVFRILQENFDLKLIEAEPPRELVTLSVLHSSKTVAVNCVVFLRCDLFSLRKGKRKQKSFDTYSCTVDHVSSQCMPIL